MYHTLGWSRQHADPRVVTREKRRLQLLHSLHIYPGDHPPDLTNPAQAKETWVGHLPDTDGQVLNAKCQMLSAKC